MEKTKYEAAKEVFEEWDNTQHCQPSGFRAWLVSKQPSAKSSAFDLFTEYDSKVHMSRTMLTQRYEIFLKTFGAHFKETIS